MNGRYLLDTNIIIAFFVGEAAIHKRLGQAEEIFIPCIALGELYYGAYKAGRTKANIERINEFSIASAVLGCDLDTAREYGLIKNKLRQKGRPIPENDIWIAAIAQQYDLILVTRDKHFGAIEGLKQEIW
jgi:tRNA(fMet)-specific endonuclease VapC